MRIFLSLNQNRVGAKSALDETVLGEESLYHEKSSPDDHSNRED